MQQIDRIAPMPRQQRRLGTHFHDIAPTRADPAKCRTGAFAITQRKVRARQQQQHRAIIVRHVERGEHRTARGHIVFGGKRALRVGKPRLRVHVSAGGHDQRKAKNQTRLHHRAGCQIPLKFR